MINKEDRLGEREGDVGTVGKMDGVGRDPMESARTQLPEDGDGESDGGRGGDRGEGGDL